MQNHYISIKDVKRLKELARSLKRSKGISHTVALDEIAKEHGFNHWHHVTLSCKPFKLAQEAFNKGFVLAFDVKDALDIDPDNLLIEDEFLREVTEPSFYKYYSKLIYEGEGDDEPTKTLKEAYPDDIFHENFINFVNDHSFYRLDESLWNQPLTAIPKFVRKYSFWMPVYIWARGILVSTYDLPTEDDDGNIAGIRF